MIPLEWTVEYSTGIPKIDSQHAYLFELANRLARALASVINLLDPDVIVLGGGVSRMAHLYDQVPRLWGRWVVSGGQHDEVRTRLAPARHGDASGVRGAAWLWRH